MQADHASAPTFWPVPPPPRNALPHLLHPTCHPALPPLAAGTSPAPPPTSTAKQTPCSQPIPPRAPLPLPLPPHPTPTSPSQALRWRQGQRAAAGSWGPHSSPQHRDTLQHACNSPHGPPSDACEQLLLQAPSRWPHHSLPSPAVRHGARPRRSRCAWARAKSPPGTAGLWAVGLQATAGQRLRLEAGRALGPQARSLRALPHPTPRETDPEATAWRAGDRGGQCVCVCVRARGRGWAHVGACRKACGTRVHETLLSTRPHGSPVDSARGLGVGDLSPRTLTARGTCPCTPRPATGTRRRPRRARRGT